MRIGIVGVGHLAGYLVAGWSRAGAKPDLVLSPRNARRAAALAERFGARVAADNQAVVDTADLVVLATRPGDAVDVLRGLAFRPGQLLVSVAAGLPLSALRPAAEPAVVVRAMPLSTAAIGESPTFLYPSHPEVERLFGLFGSVHPLGSEQQFAVASALTAFYACTYALMDQVAGWAASNGLPPETARDLVLRMVRGAAGMALAHGDEPLSDMFASLATPGGISELNLRVLDERGALPAWTAALDAVLARLITTEIRSDTEDTERS